MEITKPIGANFKWLGGGPVADLEVRREPADIGSYVNISAWKPSAEELATLNSGGVVVLHVFGTQHPPVWVGVEQKPH